MAFVRLPLCATPIPPELVSAKNGCTFLKAVPTVVEYLLWPLNLKDSLTFPWVEKGSIYLIKVFPNQKQYEDAKEKVQDV